MKLNIPTALAFLVVNLINPVAFSQNDFLTNASTIISYSDNLSTTTPKKDEPIFATAIIEDNFSKSIKHNYEMQLNSYNNSKTIFILSNLQTENAQISISGIANGADGKVIIIKTQSPNSKINLTSLDKNSKSENQFKISSDFNSDGYSSIKLMYSTSDYKWHVLSQK